MAYSLFILPRAQKQLARLPKGDYERVKAKIQGLTQNPRPPGCKKLAGRQAWRIRSGNYRVIYAIDDNVLKVTVVKVGHRSGVYD